MKKEVRSQPRPLRRSISYPSKRSGWRSRAARGAQRAPRGAPGASTEASFYMYFMRFSARCSKYIEKERKVKIEDCFAKIFTRFVNLRKPFKFRGLKRTPKSARERSQRTSKRAPKTVPEAPRRMKQAQCAICGALWGGDLTGRFFWSSGP